MISAGVIPKPRSLQDARADLIKRSHRLPHNHPDRAKVEQMIDSLDAEIERRRARASSQAAP
jgi:hypothetical protein